MSARPATEAAVELAAVTAGYGTDPVFTQLDLRIEEGDLFGIVGPSGSGKTTLLRLALGTLRPAGGTVRVLGRDPARSARRGVAFVPQVETVDWNFPATVLDVVLMGAASEAPLRPWSGRRLRDRARDLIGSLGIGDVGANQIRDLSGGQQQRAFMARALMREPELLLLDEPTSSVDLSTRADILDLLTTLNAGGTTIVLTTHDLNSVAARMDRLACVNRRLIAVGTPDEVFTPPVLADTFGADFAVLRHDGERIATTLPVGAGHGHHIHIHHDHDAESRPRGRGGDAP